MSQQPESTSPQRAVSLAGKPEPAPAAAPNSEPRHASQRIPPWLESAELFLRTFVLMFIGLTICIAPWSGQLVINYPQLQYYFPHLREFWDQNPLFVQFPALSVYAANGAVRGLVSGLGLLNLWIAFYNALHYRDG
jgi:hypothetical protein